MSKYLLVGDPHVTPTELEDSAMLMGYTLDIAQKQQATIVIMGDSFHTMSVLRLEVVDFWRTVYRACKDAGVRVISLRGNHDSGGDLSALSTCEDLIEVINDYYIENGILFASYTTDHKTFIDKCNEASSQVPGVDILLTHMTFLGSIYENGFPAPDGIDQKLIHIGNIISGHIHTPQKIGKVTYIGAPRWRTISDANLSRAIWLYDIENGVIKSATPYSTDDVCTRIVLDLDTEKKPITDYDIEKAKGHDWRVDIKGSREYVLNRKLVLQSFGAKVRTFIDQDKIIKVKESDGLDVALSKFINDYQSRYGIDNETLRALIKERLELNV